MVTFKLLFRGKAFARTLHTLILIIINALLITFKDYFNGIVRGNTYNY